jgi:hypothetical protein
MSPTERPYRNLDQAIHFLRIHAAPFCCCDRTVRSRMGALAPDPEDDRRSSIQPRGGGRYVFKRVGFRDTRVAVAGAVRRGAVLLLPGVRANRLSMVRRAEFLRPGVMRYGQDRDEAVAAVQALGLRVIAERLENREVSAEFRNVTFRAV